MKQQNATDKENGFAGILQGWTEDDYEHGASW